MTDRQIFRQIDRHSQERVVIETRQTQVRRERDNRSLTVESVCRRTRESKTRKGCVAVKPCTRIPSLSLSPLWSRSKRRSRRRRRKASTTCAAAAACCGSCKNKMGLWGRKAYLAFSTRHCCLIYTSSSSSSLVRSFF